MPTILNLELVSAEHRRQIEAWFRENAYPVCAACEDDCDHCPLLRDVIADDEAAFDDYREDQDTRYAAMAGVL